MSAAGIERQPESGPALRWRIAVLVGYLLDHGFGYRVVFAIVGSLHVLAFATICLAIPRIHPIEAARG